MEKVLIVDDNSQIRAVLRDLIKWFNPSVVVIEAQNGAEGVSMAVMHTPDLILMDAQMPVVDGINAVRALRDTPMTKMIPIVGMTAVQETGRIYREMGEVCDTFLQKPFNVPELNQAFQRVGGGQLYSEAILKQISGC